MSQKLCGGRGRCKKKIGELAGGLTTSRESGTARVRSVPAWWTAWTARAGSRASSRIRTPPARLSVSRRILERPRPGIFPLLIEHIFRGRLQMRLVLHLFVCPACAPHPPRILLSPHHGNIPATCWPSAIILPNSTGSNGRCVKSSTSQFPHNSKPTSAGISARARLFDNLRAAALSAEMR
jgi:hypothetical protein